MSERLIRGSEWDGGGGRGGGGGYQTEGYKCQLSVKILVFCQLSVKF